MDNDVILWWLSDENAQARKELREHSPELAQWLDVVESKIVAAEGQRQGGAERENSVTNNGNRRI